MIRIRKGRAKSIAAAGVVLAGLLGGVLVGAPSAVAESGDEAGPLGRCDRVWVKNVYGYKSKHHGKGPVYKDGRGGTITVEKIKAGEFETSVSGTVGVTAKAAVAEAKAEVSAGAAVKTSWNTKHSYSHKISRNKYGNVQYGSWGHTARVEKYLTLPNCKKSQRKTGTAKISNSKQGFRYWETSS
ncbi:hypothetical protein [Streptomyces sp. NPDC058665]|uniref:hypothetical protein n=1 Tax=Streptomyces sp. NPDC058665 TaxID=3346586 RepID=UPI0036603B2C